MKIRDLSSLTPDSVTQGKLTPLSKQYSVKPICRPSCPFLPLSPAVMIQLNDFGFATYPPGTPKLRFQCFGGVIRRVRVAGRFTNGEIRPEYKNGRHVYLHDVGFALSSWRFVVDEEPWSCSNGARRFCNYCVFIDLAKTFAEVCHTLLPFRPSKLNFNAALCARIKALLCDRSKLVYAKGKN